jgi:hypothetical protein
MEMCRSHGRFVNRSKEEPLSVLRIQSARNLELILLILGSLLGLNRRGRIVTLSNLNPIVGASKLEPAIHRSAPSTVARKGTGPRTRLGKERSKHNALRHGIFSKSVVLKSESQLEFDSLLNGLCKDFRPIGRLEETLVEILAVTLWRQHRMLIAEAAEIQAGMESIEHPEDPFAPIRAMPAYRIPYYGGLMSSIADAQSLNTCLDLLRKLKTRVSANVLDPHKDKLVLTEIYGGSPSGECLNDSFDDCVTGLTAAKCEGRGATVQGESKRQLLIELENEIERLRRYPEEQALIESNRINRKNLESRRRNVPDSPKLEQLLRYSTSLERTLDRTLNQLERAQRMRLGQPVAPRIDVNVSSS